ncbi:MAG TPA: type IV toxin-antitoxin system AbiEi family antitoxin domain-containing protein [Solirubrobacteraceae bacterium]|nr:type IV toxin-antitoxin system AbiEi family antitoxin domain-containing protein [Solirubrobacteraceae bacterium]
MRAQPDARAEDHGERDAEPVDRSIAALATAQGGVVGHAQLIALGLTRRAIGHRLSRGRLIVLHRGVYAVGHQALTDRGRGVAALLAAGPGAVLSHRAAAAFLLIVPALPARLEVTRGDDRRRSRPDLVVHRSSLDFAREVRRRDGLLLTSPARTIADLAATRPAVEVERAWAEARVQNLLQPSHLAAAITPGRRGARLLTRLVGEPEPTRSELERAMFAALRAAALPIPQSNVRIGPYLLDFLWREQRLVVETDGWAAHGHRGAFERDRMRDATLQARGYAVLRFMWRQVKYDTVRVVVAIAQVLALRSGTTSHSRPRQRRASG